MTIPIMNHLFSRGHSARFGVMSTEVLLMNFRNQNLNDFAQLMEKEIDKGRQEITYSDLEAILNGTAKRRQRKQQSAKKVAKKSPQPEKPVNGKPEEHGDSGERVAETLAEVVGSKMKGKVLRDLNTMIGGKERKRLVKVLFKKEENQFQKFMKLLNNIHDWKEASSVVDTFFYDQGIDQYGKEALMLSNMVYNRYFPKDTGHQEGVKFKF